ncbi:MAG TPA: right-handed parallel beta-helix repeat-containing protein [Kofleriaceae bacterium]|nr:right-handed parallel beta-helix repeat-containing protein [Kofleriaceae bacterium]
METFVAPAPKGDDGNDGTHGAPVATLSRAIGLGRSVIRIAAGRYRGPLTLTGTVALRGEDGVIVTGGAANRVMTIAAGANVVLEGVEVCATDHAWMAIAVDAGATATITRCRLTGGSGGGGSPTPILSWGTLHVEGCHLRGGTGDAATGVCAYGRSTIVDNEIDASHIGVNCGGATVERNRIRAGTYGIYVQGDDVVVRGNDITLDPDARNVRAVFVVRGDRLVVEHNTITGGPDPARWIALPRRTWTYDEVSDREYAQASITVNGLYFHGEADGPSGGPYGGPTQDLDDLLAHDPIRPLPADVLADIRAFLRGYLDAAAPARHD